MKSKYTEFVKSRFEEILEWYRDGANDKCVMERLGIKSSAFYSYQQKYKEFSELIKKGHDRRTDAVIDSMYRNAIGYDVEEVRTEYVEGDHSGAKGKIGFTSQTGRKRVIKTTRHIPGNVTLQIFIATNERPQQFRDVRKIEVEGSVPVKLIEEEKEL